MAAGFGSAVFEVEIQGKIRPDWITDDGVIIQKIPYSNQDDIQFAGTGSNRITVNIFVTSDAHWNTLKSYMGDGIARTLSGFLSGTFNNVYLKRVVGTRSDFAQEWSGTAEFIQQGA